MTSWRTVNRRRTRAERNRLADQVLRAAVRQALDQVLSRVLATFWLGAAPDPATLARWRATFASGGLVKQPYQDGPLRALTGCAEAVVVAKGRSRQFVEQPANEA